jgi:hypothetical protein
MVEELLFCSVLVLDVGDLHDVLARRLEEVCELRVGSGDLLAATDDSEELELGFEGCHDVVGLA